MTLLRLLMVVHGCNLAMQVYFFPRHLGKPLGALLGDLCERAVATSPRRASSNAVRTSVSNLVSSASNIVANAERLEMVTMTAMYL